MRFLEDKFAKERITKAQEEYRKLKNILDVKHHTTKKDIVESFKKIK